MTTSNRPAKTFIDRLSQDYPDFTFKPGNQEHWSPRRRTITFNPDQTLQQLQYGLLHELAHALLGHTTYQTDFELLKLESEAWELAAKTAKKYKVVITNDHIQNCLDTYRDWLHQRSACPRCGLNVVQTTPKIYTCFNCQTTWSVSSGRFKRPYRLTKNRGS